MSIVGRKILLIYLGKKKNEELIVIRVCNVRIVVLFFLLLRKLCNYVNLKNEKFVKKKKKKKKDK